MEKYQTNIFNNVNLNKEAMKFMFEISIGFYKCHNIAHFNQKTDPPEIMISLITNFYDREFNNIIKGRFETIKKILKTNGYKQLGKKLEKGEYVIITPEKKIFRLENGLQSMIRIGTTSRKLNLVNWGTNEPVHIYSYPFSDYPVNKEKLAEEFIYAGQDKD